MLCIAWLTMFFLPLPSSEVSSNSDDVSWLRQQSSTANSCVFWQTAVGVQVVQGKLCRRDPLEKCTCSEAWLNFSVVPLAIHLL